ncbi:MAG: cobalamin B12-binding domain-containing protein [Betaproteobacteria bacterium]|nr:cobalamin B12-binding domain-containing protein [Betaproteobacteria bacterium]
MGSMGQKHAEVQRRDATDRSQAQGRSHGGRAGLPADALARALWGAVIPRLFQGMTVRRRPSREVRLATRAASAFSETDIDEFAHLVLASGSDAAILAHLEALLADGMLADDICCELLGPAACRMGDWWCRDQADFTEVTVGVGRLQQAMREMSRETDGREGASFQEGPLRRILLLSASGDQHTFGLVMVSDMFARAGWQVDSDEGRTEMELLEAVRRDWYDVIGLSVVDPAGLDALAGQIIRLRQASRNPSVGIMAGGRFVSEAPEQVMCLAVDAVVVDGRLAVDTATRLVLQRTPPP